MQANSWTGSDVANAASNAAAHGTEARQLGWYLAFAFLSTAAEGMFLLSGVPSSMLG